MFIPMAYQSVSYYNAKIQIMKLFNYKNNNNKQLGIPQKITYLNFL